MYNNRNKNNSNLEVRQYHALPQTILDSPKTEQSNGVKRHFHIITV